MIKTKEELKDCSVTFSTYYGSVYIRLFQVNTDTNKNRSGVNVGKIELGHLTDYLTNKIKKGQFSITSGGKGNSLPVIELK